MVEPDDKLAHFQAVTGLEDQNLCTEILEAHGWDLELAVSAMTDGANASSSAFAENSDSTNLARNLDSTNMVGNFNSTSSHWEGVDGSDAQNNHIVPNPAAPGLVWKLVSLPFFVVRGGFGLISGAVGFGMWVAGGVLSHSLNAIGWGPGQGQSDGNQNAPLVSLSSGVAEAVSFLV